jgi:hypothetical protein
MPDSTTAPRRAHHLGDEEPRVLMGLGWTEITALGLLLGTGLMVLATRKDTSGVIVGFGLATFGGLLAWGRHGGQSLATWTAIWARHHSGRLVGHHQWRRSITAGRRRGELREQVELPGELGRLHLLETALNEDGTGPPIGVFHDRRGDTYTGTLLVASTSNFGLLGHEDQDRRLADWAGALEELARDQSPIRRIAWVERTLPERPDALADYLHQHRDPTLPLDASPVRSYLELLDHAGTTTDRHELLVSVQISGRAARRHARGRGWTRTDAALRVLAGELDLTAQALQQAGLDVRMPLSADGLVSAMRVSLDPWAPPRPPTSGLPTAEVATGAAPDRSPDTNLSDTDPVGELAGTDRTAARDHVLWDGAQHTTMWVAQWPRQPVRSMFLAPLLMRSESTRAVAVVMELLGPERGLRQAEATVADDESTEALRWRGGVRTRRRIAKREQSNRQREDELADGHIDIRWSGYVSVAVPGDDPHLRHQAVDRVRAQAARCGLRLEVMAGQQPEALTFVMPLGRGLR